MKYFNAFLSKGNPQVHGQILWFTLPKSLYILFPQPVYWENYKYIYWIWVLCWFWLPNKHDKTLDCKYLHKKTPQTQHAELDIFNIAIYYSTNLQRHIILVQL